MRKLLLNILPGGLIRFYKDAKKRRKQNQRQQLAQANQTVTEDDIVKALQDAGVKHNEVLMLHSALSKLGFVKDGTETVINAVIRVVGEQGTVMMPSFPAVGFNYDYLKTNPVFDVRNSPSKMGAITEAFRKRSGVERSLHPTDPVCALGKQALYLTKDHVNQLTPYNENSPFYRLCELKGKIVLMGVDLDSLTNLHTLEDAVDNFEYPVYHPMVFTTKLVDADGTALEMKTKVHNPLYSKKRRCNALLPHFEEAGFLKQFKVGLANCIIIEAYAMHQWMLENYRTKGITMYTPDGK